jgi:Mrp family chromosome partitioning ATPase
MPGEGKTTVAAGLATVAATQDHQRVLTVDLNWHAPALHTLFGLGLIEAERLPSRPAGPPPAPPKEGKPDEVVLEGAEVLRGLVQPSGLNGLEILSAVDGVPPGSGGGNVTELGLGIVQWARRAYDTVVLDASSVFPTNRRMMDPVALARAVDGVILVVLANVTSRHMVKRARMMLDAAGAKLLGVVVNQWKNPLA